MNADQLRAVYDRVAARYAAVFVDELDRKPADRDLLDWFAARHRGESPVLDVGCGPGHIARYLHDRGVAVTGVDLSPAMVRIAQRVNPGLEFRVGDLTALDDPDASYAGIVAFYSIIHLQRSAVPAALRELRRVVRTDGTFVVAVHAGQDTVHTDSFLDQPVEVDATLFEPDELVSLVDAAGFAVERVYQRPPYPSEHPTDRLYLAARATTDG